MQRQLRCCVSTGLGLPSSVSRPACRQSLTTSCSASRRCRAIRYHPIGSARRGVATARSSASRPASTTSATSKRRCCSMPARPSPLSPLASATATPRRHSRCTAPHARRGHPRGLGRRRGPAEPSDRRLCVACQSLRSGSALRSMAGWASKLDCPIAGRCGA